MLRVRKLLAGITLLGLGVTAVVTAAGPAQAAPDRKYGPPVEIADASSEADAINNAGLVVGMASGSDFVPHAFTWQAGVRTDIGSGWIPRAVADTGHIAGDVVGTDGKPTRAVLWVDGAFTDLGTLGGPSSHVMAMNDRDQVVGYSDLPDGRIGAFLWQNGTMTALANPYGGNSAARDINARGEIVGWAVDQAGATGGVRWRGGAVTFLGATVIQDAAAINDRGDIVGNTYVGADLHARLWRHGQVTDLGSMGHKGPNGDSYTRADDLTDDGLVTGDSYGADGIRHAFVWNAGKYTDLGQGLAVGITATGTVAGNAAEFPRVGLVWQPLT
jgi:probable HAF family extracellular repeat protein